MDVNELKDEWELLEPVRGELETWKAALRMDARNRLAKEAAGEYAPLRPGQIVGQKIFHIYVDRPQERERITTKLHRHFYEREYVRVVSPLLTASTVPSAAHALTGRYAAEGWKWFQVAVKDPAGEGGWGTFTLQSGLSDLEERACQNKKEQDVRL